jgi:methylaspartate ammonia-lyase
VESTADEQKLPIALKYGLINAIVAKDAATREDSREDAFVMH